MTQVHNGAFIERCDQLLCFIAYFLQRASIVLFALLRLLGKAALFKRCDQLL
jgi:hypothetical protein